jgi:aspartyl-tRNA(Asn)/glutamyl-tRNA(Gln) amidotransferase subunit B
MSDYLPTIGIECHVQFHTKTKLFSAVGNDAREADPNTLISHIDLGMPGALPVLNQKALELGMRAAFALGTEPQAISKFDRKHYFYPDLPMGYQITQFYNPIIRNGKVEITVDGQPKVIRVLEAHLEADAGKSTHPAGADYSLVDLNRAGTPLLEIVSEPDLHSPKEARIYAKELWLLMRYADISDASLFYGNMRFDVNVSVSKDPKKLGTRSETKNLNSFRSVEKAAEFEINRQIELLEKGKSIVQETRGWDDAKQKTFSQRSKEEAHDYRYMPEPDIPPIELTEVMIKPIRESMPLLPNDYRKSLHQAGIEQSTIEILLQSPARTKFVNEIADKHGLEHARRISNLIVNAIEKLTQSEDEATSVPVSVEAAVKLSQLLADNKLSSTAGRKVWVVMNLTGKDPLEIAQAENLLQVSDEGAIEKIVSEVLKANPQAAEDVKNGEMKAIGFLVGQVMKDSKGQANPQLAQKLIKKLLGTV